MPLSPGDKLGPRTTKGYQFRSHSAAAAPATTQPYASNRKDPGREQIHLNQPQGPQVFSHLGFREACVAGIGCRAIGACAVHVFISSAQRDGLLPEQRSKPLCGCFPTPLSSCSCGSACMRTAGATPWPPLLRNLRVPCGDRKRKSKPIFRNFGRKEYVFGVHRALTGGSESFHFATWSPTMVRPTTDVVVQKCMFFSRKVRRKAVRTVNPWITTR